MALREAVRTNAEGHAQDMAQAVASIWASGSTSLQPMAAELNDRGMMARRGWKWQVSNVRNLLERI
jgi:hypothetical protein